MKWGAAKGNNGMTCHACLQSMHACLRGSGACLRSMHAYLRGMHGMFASVLWICTINWRMELSASTFDIRTWAWDHLDAWLLTCVLGHSRCGSSFDVAIVSEAFEGKNLLARHRMVRCICRGGPCARLAERAFCSCFRCCMELQWCILLQTLPLACRCYGSGRSAVAHLRGLCR